MGGGLMSTTMEILVLWRKEGAPTLAGIKTGNLFSCCYAGWEALRQDLRRLNRSLTPKGVRILPLGYGVEEKRVLLYVYRPDRLRKDLLDQRVDALLQACGYSCRHLGRFLVQLMHRLRNGGDFPHEIGLFLSYPSEDVFGFIRYPGEQYKCLGCWKVYGDEITARQTFARYRKCTEPHCHCWTKGRSVYSFTIAERPAAPEQTVEPDCYGRTRR